MAPTARGEEVAAPAEMTSALCHTWTPSVTATCSATAPCPTVVLTSGATAWEQLLHILPVLVKGMVRGFTQEQHTKRTVIYARVVKMGAGNVSIMPV